MHTLLLWDIDGTLLLSGGAGERALQVALRDAFGLTDSLAAIELAGRTDRWIARRVLSQVDLPATDETIARYLDAYLNVLAGEFARPGGQVLPGVPEILARLARRRDVAQGLLTGNLRRGAEIKLRAHGLWAHFPFGAFADDAELRNDLGPHALRRAREHHGVAFPPDRVFVIGDTPHDIACGQAIGARTIGVATGRYSVDDLRACRPTTVLPDLGDAAAFLAAIA
jgi:phosphoglycolate phosphatase